MDVTDLKILSTEEGASILTRETINLNNPDLLIISPNDENIFSLI